MESQPISIPNKETTVFEDLTITNLGVGHKILMAEGGGRGGDLLFAEVTLQTPRVPATEMRLYASAEEPGVITFDTYEITSVELPDDAQSVVVHVRKSS